MANAGLSPVDYAVDYAVTIALVFTAGMMATHLVCRLVERALQEFSRGRVKRIEGHTA